MGGLDRPATPWRRTVKLVTFVLALFVGMFSVSPPAHAHFTDPHDGVWAAGFINEVTKWPTNEELSISVLGRYGGPQPNTGINYVSVYDLTFSPDLLIKSATVTGSEE